MAGAPPTPGDRWRTWVRPMAAVGVATGLYFVLPLGAGDLRDWQWVVRGLGLLLGLPGLTWLVATQVRRAMDAGRRIGERLAMLITVVDVVVVFFAALYTLLADQFDGLDTRLDALYFAVTTLTTVGYGDITATGQAARAVVIVQMFFDLIIVTSAISIVVGALNPPRSPA